MRKLLLLVTILLVGSLFLNSFAIAYSIETRKDKMENSPPEKPTVTGTWYFKAGEPYECKIYAVDPDGDNVSYQVDWDDGEISNWIEWFQSGEEITQSHYFSEKGSFSIRARAKDIYGQIGPWGIIHFGVVQGEYNLVGTIPIKISIDSPDIESNPESQQYTLPPGKLWINNPIEVWVGVEYTFNITIEDPEGDNIFIYIDWGDGTYKDWNGPYESGEPILFTKYWTEIGTIVIKIKARDEYGQESEWQSFIINVIPPPRLFIDMEFNGMLNTRLWRGLIFSLISFDKATVTKGISKSMNLEPFTCHDYKFVTLALNIKSYDKDKLYIDASAPLMILVGY